MTATNQPTPPPTTLLPKHPAAAHAAPPHRKCIHGLHFERDLTPTEISVLASAEPHGGYVAGIWLPCATPGCGCKAGVFRLRDALKACVRRQQRDGAGAGAEAGAGAGEHVFCRRDAMVRLPLQWPRLVEKYAIEKKYSDYQSWLGMFVPGYAMLRGW
jgi:hypothetical protein